MMIFNRKLYKKIKKMDRQEMEDFITNIYHLGFKDGVEAGSNADFKIKLAEVLKKTKGIGPKLFERIIESAKEMEGEE